MRSITVREAQRLTPPVFGPAVSIYLDADSEGRKKPTVLKRALSDLCSSAEHMIEQSCDSESARRIIKPLYRMLTMGLPRNPLKSLAIYHSAEFTRSVELPVRVEDQIIVADSFHIKPLLRCVQMRADCLLLLLTNGQGILHSVTLDGTKEIVRIPIAQRPIHEDYGTGSNRCWFLGELAAMRHDGLLQAMRTLNRMLHPYWNKDFRPLVLAGPQHQQTAFRKVCTSTNLLPRGISGYVEDLNEQQLAGMAGDVVEKDSDALDGQAVASYERAESLGHATSNLGEIGRIAANGGVADLLIATDTNLWGSYDRTNGTVKVLDRQTRRLVCDDVLDDIAEVVLSKGGKVRVIPRAAMPAQTPIAAVFAIA